MKFLKEWAAVVSALESGDQCVILRKGGIMETASGFVTESSRFFLFPTWEHQDAARIRPEFIHHIRDIRKPRDGTNRITSYAEVIAEVDIPGSRDISVISSMHVWSDAYIRERRDWLPSKPLKALLLRIFTIPAKEIPTSPQYAGCRSWIDITFDDIGGKPVLDDRQMQTKLHEFRRMIS